jgi:hypothetical protein
MEDKAHGRAELRQAERLYAEQRYAELVRHLAPQIFLFRANARYFHLLGIASLHIGDIGGAYSYLQRGKDLDPLNPDLLLSLAIAHLGRKEEPQALQVLVGLQDLHPTNDRTIRLLETIKQASDRTDWADQIKLGKLRHLYPVPGFNWRKWLRRCLLAFGGLAGLVLLGLGIAGIVNVMARWQPPLRNGAERSAAVSSPGPTAEGPAGTDDSRFGVAPGAAPRFQLSPGEIDSLVRDATVAFREYRDNRARLMVNRVMQSNASAAVKERMRGLAGHFKDPGFTNFHDNFEPSAVEADPVLHAGVFVMWRGKLADVQKGQTAITFNLLVGYENSPVVLAKVPVSLGFAADVHDGEPVELIGQVQADPETGTFSLKGTALRLIRG